MKGGVFLSIGFSNGTKTLSDRKSVIALTTRRLALVVLDILAVNLAFFIVSALNYPREELYALIFSASHQNQSPILLIRLRSTAASFPHSDPPASRSQKPQLRSHADNSCGT